MQSREELNHGQCWFRLYYGPEFIAMALRAWYRILAVAPLFPTG